MQVLIGFLLILAASVGEASNDSFSPLNPIRSMNPANLDFDSPNTDQCAMGVDRLGLPRDKKIRVTLNSLNSNAGTYLVKLAICDKDDCLAHDSAGELSSQNVGQTIIMLSTSELGCTAYRYKIEGPARLQFRFFQETPLFSDDILLGNSYLDFSEISEPKFIPLTGYKRGPSIRVELVELDAN